MSLSNADIDALLSSEASDFEKQKEVRRILTQFELDYYAILDIVPGFDDSKIKSLFRRKSLLVHPDKNPAEGAKEAFDRLNKAMEALKDNASVLSLESIYKEGLMQLYNDGKLSTTDYMKLSDPEVSLLRQVVGLLLLEQEKSKAKKLKLQQKDELRKQMAEEELIKSASAEKSFQEKWEQTRQQRMGSWRQFRKSKSIQKKSDKKFLG
ncbi:hypothetical protein CANCADRAFT_85593 [Tortispora caseinolytica NRRL Y-17796]|uniref:J domain-containing protein n=1 Tax=Tortispora caseinolytica NRRL Y-17796 TaxID=767744 RepID=A0A1E4TKS3_9ASCO|nr:hypothetical protein CANCADRAFT_85593 [Tortispora caseinolytica NRRL Y-17796]